jgi:hypothetical protein
MKATAMHEYLDNWEPYGAGSIIEDKPYLGILAI